METIAGLEEQGERKVYQRRMRRPRGMKYM